jgi:hypothetical protein
MYRNVVSFSRKGKQIVWESTWDKNGNRINIESEITPYLMYEDHTCTDKTYMSMYGKPLKKLEFPTSYDRSEWIKSARGIPLFETLSPVNQYLLNKYSGKEREEAFTKNKFKVYFLDLEIQVDGCFPDADFAEYPINVISLIDSLTNNVHVWAYKSDISKYFSKEKILDITKKAKSEDTSIKKIIIHTFDNELNMLNNFLDFWANDPPDVVTRMEYKSIRYGLFNKSTI